MREQDPDDMQPNDPVFYSAAIFTLRADMFEDSSAITVDARAIGLVR